MKVSIRPANNEDVDSIVRIHQEAFQDFFLTSLGAKFLRLYYSSFINSGRGVVCCAEGENGVIGFAACSYKSRGFNIQLIKNNLIKFGLESLRLLFSKPKAIIRLVNNLNKSSIESSVEDKGQYAELYSIAVSTKYQGEGVGRLLLTAIETDAVEHNSQISLTTDYYNNEKVISFYRALGYEVFYDFIAYPDRRMYRMIKDLK